MKKNKKYTTLILSTIVIVIAILFGFLNNRNNKNEVELEEVVLNEVVRSVFYVPQYVALSEGYFKDNGLEVKLITGNGADKSMTSLITGESDIILAGPESSMYLKVNDEAKEVINIAQLTNRAGNFLIARDEVDTFNWEDVKGKTIIGGRPGGIPEITLEYILKENNLEPFKDVEIVTNIDFTATAGAFATGTFDYTVEFEPNATIMENEGYGKVVASLGVDGGEIPYTSYITTNKYAKENEETLIKFLTAMKEAQIFIQDNTSEEIVDSIIIYFDNIPKEDLIKIIDRYKEQDTWNEELYCDIEGYKKLQNILIDAGTLEKEIDLETLINNSFIDKVGDE